MDLTKDELVTQISNSNEQKFYLIASPICKHERKSLPCFSDVSSGSSKNSSILSCHEDNTNTSPRSRMNLEKHKRLLLDQILAIEDELKILNDEECALKSLQLNLKKYNSKIFSSDKSSKQVTTVEQIRETIQSFDDNLAGFLSDLTSLPSLPHSEDIKANINEIGKFLSMILKKKSSPEVSILMDMLCSIGELCGSTSIILALFYQNAETIQFFNSETSWKSEPSVNEETKDESDISESTNGDTDSLNLTTESLEVAFSMKNSLTKRSPPRNTLKIFRMIVKSCANIQVVIKSAERLSSGNPKMKSLKSCFAKANEAIGKIREQDFAVGSKSMESLKLEERLNKLKTLTQVEKPTQTALEEILFAVSELKGSVKILIKDYLQNKNEIPSEFFPERTATI